MSLNKRRWANDLMDSLMDFQSREGSDLAVDSLEEKTVTDVSADSLNKSSDITSMIAMLNLDNSQKVTVSHQKSNTKISITSEEINTSSYGSEQDSASNNVLNLSMIENCYLATEESNSASAVEEDLNRSMIEEINDLDKTSSTTPAQFGHLFNLNERLTENITLNSDSGTIKLSSCNSSNQCSSEATSVESQINYHSRLLQSATQNINCISYETDRVTDNITLSSGSETIKLSSCNSSSVQSNDYLLRMSEEVAQSKDCDLNERVMENITLSSGSETIKLSSCNSSTTRNSSESQSVENQNNYYLLRISEEVTQHCDCKMNEKIMENITLSSDSGIVKQLSSCNSSMSQNKAQSNIVESQPNQYLAEIVNEDHNNQRFFSSPFEFSKTAEEIISEMNEPDVWEALLALEQALSPVEDFNQSCQEQHQDQAHVLTRLSQKFKETPSRFTEKLVSILEDSVISLESPTKEIHKHDAHNSSGISLHRMTGEFRKLCKFIEDESMPEWAPSLMNMTTYLEKTETPEYEKNKNVNNETPKNMLRCIKETPKQNKAFQNYATPKNQIRLNTDTPIKKFTPSADKSFEYWEKICNMMCENQSSSKKKAKNRNSLCARESAKHVNEILSICERQLASLDDSTIDIRTSEPCKKTDSELKLKVIQPQRSKSASKVFPSTDEKRNCSPDKKCSSRRIDKKLFFDDDVESPNKSERHIYNEDFYKENVDLTNESDNLEDSFEFLRNRELKTNVQKSFEDDYEFMLPSSKERHEKVNTENLYNDNDADCSLLIELAKRRQRCLDTAKLMLEIDREDPITNEDSKCLETLYKLGVQDKTFAEVEEDTKFLNTLNECLEYKKYFRDKSKPLINMLQKYDSPDDLKKKTKSVMRCSKSSTRPQTSNIITKSKISTKNKPLLEPKNTLKSLHERKMTPRIIPKTLPRSTPKVQKKISPLSNVQQVKITPRVSSKSVIKVSPEVNTRVTQSQKKISPKLTSRPVTKTPQPDNKSTQLNKVTPKATLKITPKSDQKRFTPKLSVPKVVQTSEDVDSPREHLAELSPVICEKRESSMTPKSSPKVKYFATPGKSPSTAILGRRKPLTYFSDLRRPTPQKMTYDSVKSPISLYINGTDTELIQNAQTRINDRLLTPISNEVGKSPKLKFKLSSKENKSPVVNENIVLPTVRYEAAKKVRLIDDKSSYSPCSMTPNSVTKKLLGPIENTVVIRHEGRVIEYSPKSQILDSETSIRFQKMAEKTSSLRKKYV